MQLLDIYTDYLISQNKYAIATGLSDMVDGAISHDKVSRFFNKNKLGSNELWQYVKPSVHKHQSAIGGVLLLDDFIEEKPYTDENEVNCWHYSHAKG